MKSLTYIAAVIGITLLAGSTSAYAQNATIETNEATSTPIEITPNPFPLVPAEPAPSTTTPAIIPTTTEPVVEDTPEEKPVPTTSTPKPKPVTPTKQKLQKQVIKEGGATSTTTASTTEFIPLTPGTVVPGNVYRNLIHLPLNQETSLYLFAVATLCAILGSFMVEKNRLDRLGSSIATLFSPLRSLPHPADGGASPRTGRQ